MMAAIALLGGLVLLVLGGELLVRGAVRIAGRLGVPPLIVGLTLVGFGTSTPELVTSVQAALSGAPGIAYGNIVGSNIANILLILGLAALVAPIPIGAAALRRDCTVLLAVAAAFAGLALLGPLGRVVGTGFLVALAAYIVLAVRQERRREHAPHGAVYDKALATQTADPALAPPEPGPAGTSPRPLTMALVLAAAGLALVIAGGHLLVTGAVDLARGLGLAESVIGLTIVAVGTSLPEFVTSLLAARRGESEVAFGNIVGSNIYNILGIGGVTAVVAPTAVPAEIVGFDVPVMLVASGLQLAFTWTGRRIGRAEGGVLLAAYIGYVAWLWP